MQGVISGIAQRIAWPQVTARLLLVVAHLVMLALIGTGMPSAAAEGSARPHLPPLGIVAHTDTAQGVAPDQTLVAPEQGLPPDHAVSDIAPQGKPDVALAAVAFMAFSAAWGADPPPLLPTRIVPPRHYRVRTDIRLRIHRTVVLHL